MSADANPSAFCPCGADCTACERYPDVCGGCFAILGKVWWTAYTGQEVCPFYDCCVGEKGLAHCGHCPDFPCEHFRQGDPAKSDAENAAIYQRQLERLTGSMGRGEGDAL